MRTRSIILSATLLLGPIASQELEKVPDLGFRVLPNGLRYLCFHVPDCKRICVLAAVRVGAHHDPSGQTGLAASMGWLLRLVQREQPPAERFQIDANGPATLIGALRGRRDLTACLQWLATVLGGELAFSDDLVQLARGRAARTADDQATVLPGPALEMLTRRRLFAGTPAGRQTVGIPSEIEALGDAVVRGRYRQLFRPRHTVLVVMGGEPVEAMESAVHAALAGLPAGEHAAPAAQVHDSAPPFGERVESVRVAAPYVSMALRAPAFDSPDYLPFLIAMDVVRTYVAQSFMRARGREGYAGFPPFDVDDGDALQMVRINRRSPDGSGPEVARREIDDLMDAVGGLQVPAETIARAAANTALRLQLPPYGDRVLREMTSPRLAQRARTLVMAEVVGLPPDLPNLIGAVAVGRVQQAIRAALAAENRHWFVMVRK